MNLSAAQPWPKYSNGNKTVTITIKPGLKWSDGSAVDGQDVAFFYHVLKAATNESPSNWCQYASSTQFPYNVKSLTYHGNTVLSFAPGRTPVNPDVVHVQPAAGHQRWRHLMPVERLGA